MKKTQVKCHHCNGTGQLNLSEEMQLTLDAMKFLKRASSTEVATAVHWNHHPTAINNRLEFLRAHGLLSREKFGKTWIYKLA